MAALNLGHQTVNHSEHFIDPITGVHTQAIEGLWPKVKATVPRRNDRMHLISGSLFAYAWFKLHKTHCWHHILTVMCNTCIDNSVNDEEDDEDDQV